MKVRVELKSRIFILFSLVLFVFSGELKAREDHVFYSEDKTFVFVTGSITEASAHHFNTMILTNRAIRGVVLDSPGGLVMPALSIADAVNKRGLITFIPEGRECFSACSLIFFAGHTRFADGDLGVHQLSNTSASGAQLILSITLDAFERYGVDRAISRRMLTTLPNDMYVFNDDEKIEYGINRYKEEYLVSREIEEVTETAFSQYPPTSQFSQDKVVLPDFSGRDAWARLYRTRIRNGLLEGPDFAGHYKIIEIGCGMGCRFAYVADANNGEVFDFPFGGEENFEMSLLYTINSRLVKVTWIQKHETCIRQDIVFDGREFQLVHESSYKMTGMICD